MSDKPYRVGGLELDFTAIDKTEKEFKKIKSSLTGIAENLKSIGSLSTSELGNFNKVVAAVHSSLSPLLADVKGATDGFVALNSVVKKIGVKNLSSLANRVSEIRRETETLDENLNVSDSGQIGFDFARIEAAQEEARRAAEQARLAALERQKQLIQSIIADKEKEKRIYSEINTDILNTNKSIETTKKRIAEIQSQLETVDPTSENATNLINEYNNAKATLESLGSTLQKLRSEFGAPFNEAQAQVSKLTNQLLNMHYALGTVDNATVNEIVNTQKAIDVTTRAVKRALMTEQEKTIADYQDLQAEKQKKKAYYEAALALGTAGDKTEEYRQALERMRTADMSPYERVKDSVSQLTKELTKLAHGQLVASGKIDIYDTAKAQKLREYKTTLEQVSEAVKQAAMSEQELVLYQHQQEVSTRKQRIEYLNLMLSTGKAGKKTQEYRQELRQLIKEQNSADKSSKKLAKGGLGTLINRIGRIALYRTIRAGLKLVTQTFTESINAYAEVDDNINNIMSQLTRSGKIIQLSLGTTILPLLQTIQPTVQQIALGFADLANAINKSMALAQGNATYTKINTEALKDYRKEINKTSGALFDFDKFRALSNKQDTASTFLSTESISELDEAETKYSNIYSLVQQLGEFISTGLTTIGKIKEELSPISGFIMEIAKSVLEVFSNSDILKATIYGILGYLTIMKGMQLVSWIGGICKSVASGISAFNAWAIAIAAVSAAVMILSNWDKFSTNTKIAITVISGLIAVLTTAAIAAMALHGALTIGTAVPLIITAVAAGAIAIGGAIKGYEDGGLPDKGTMFVAGEAGAEFVYNMPSGQSGVANIQQIAQAVYQGTYQATVDWWKNAKGDIGNDVYLDGEVLYKNTKGHAKAHGESFAKIR